MEDKIGLIIGIGKTMKSLWKQDLQSSKSFVHKYDAEIVERKAFLNY